MENIKELELKFIGIDSWQRPVYENGDKQLFKNVNLKEKDIKGLCTVYGGFEGEPDTPLEYTKFKDSKIKFI